jgi:hypothetical protein
MRRLCSRPVAVGFVCGRMGRVFRAHEVGRHIEMSAFGVYYLAHNIKPWVVCEERREALLIRAIFPVSGMMVLYDGLECAHLSPMCGGAF